MKKYILLLLGILSLFGCQKFEEESQEPAPPDEWSIIHLNEMKKFTFTIKGDFVAAAFSRAYLQADGQDMTDLWVFDYMAGQCVQSLHLTKDDENFGKPVMYLTYGAHHVYFVASRGEEPTLDAEGHVLVWSSPRDTFWKDYAVEVVTTSNGNRAVTLDRVATKLRLVVNDEVPAGCASVTVMPDRWYYGLDYLTGEAVSAQKKERSVAVPASYIGTTGQLAVSIFGLSGADEWTTNLSVAARDAEGNSIGSASIAGAPFVRNRATEYSGNLFASGGAMDISLSAEWQPSYTGTW